MWRRRNIISCVSCVPLDFEHVRKHHPFQYQSVLSHSSTVVSVSVLSESRQRTEERAGRCQRREQRQKPECGGTKRRSVMTHSVRHTVQRNTQEVCLEIWISPLNMNPGTYYFKVVS